MGKMKLALMIVAIIGIVVIAGSVLYYYVFYRPGIKKADIALKTQQEQTQEQKFETARQEIIKFDEEYWEIAEEYTPLQEENNKKLKDLIRDVENNPNLDYSPASKNLTDKINKDYSEYIQKFKSLTIPNPLDEFYYKKIEQFNAFQSQNTDKGQALRVEAMQIQREVYREYGLDDLIQKWQED